MCVGGPRVPAPTWWRFVWTHSTELILTPVATLLQRKETGRIGGGDRRVGEGPSKPEETFKAPLPTDDGTGVGHPMWNIIIPLGRLLEAQCPRILSRGCWGISGGVMGFSVIGPIGISCSELYALVSLVQSFSAKWLNHIVHVIHEKNKSETV